MDLKAENEILKAELRKALFFQKWSTGKYQHVAEAQAAADRQIARLLRDKSGRGGA